MHHELSVQACMVHGRAAASGGRLTGAGSRSTADGVGRGRTEGPYIHRRRLRESAQLDTHLADWCAAPQHRGTGVLLCVCPPGTPRHGAGVDSECSGQASSALSPRTWRPPALWALGGEHDAGIAARRTDAVLPAFAKEGWGWCECIERRWVGVLRMAVGTPKDVISL